MIISCLLKLQLISILEALPKSIIIWNTFENCRWFVLASLQTLWSLLLSSSTFLWPCTWFSTIEDNSFNFYVSLLYILTFCDDLCPVLCIIVSSSTLPSYNLVAAVIPSLKPPLLCRYSRTLRVTRKHSEFGLIIQVEHFCIVGDHGSSMPMLGGQGIPQDIFLKIHI